jgi:hypothetical protein
VRAQGDGVIGGDHALVVQAQATGQIEALGQAAKSADCSRHRSGPARRWLALEWRRGPSAVR